MAFEDCDELIMKIKMDILQYYMYLYNSITVCIYTV